MSAAGKWNVVMDTPLGTQKFVWDLRQADGGWSGTMDARSGASDLQNVRVDGDSVGFDTRVNSPMGAVDLSFSGRVNGDQISGTCKTAFGNAQFTGQRT